MKPIDDDTRLVLDAAHSLRNLLQEILESIAVSVWPCGCGHVNGANLAICAKCNRPPGCPR